jgi:hypothetical protein
MFLEIILFSIEIILIINLQKIKITIISDLLKFKKEKKNSDPFLLPELSI